MGAIAPSPSFKAMRNTAVRPTPEPTRTDTPWQDWADATDQRMMEPFLKLSHQIDEIKEAIANQDKAKNDRKTILICCWIIFGGTAYIQVLHPLVVRPTAGAVGIIGRVFQATERLTGRGEPSPTAADKVVKLAESWADRSFKPGVTAQCAVFVRHVFNQLGYELPVTKSPLDNAFPVSPETANSFYGREVGEIINDPAKLEPGDLVLFYNTYGTYAEGTVTHVGIYIGDGMMIDRPTSDRPVQRRAITTFKFAAGVRPKLGGTNAN